MHHDQSRLLRCALHSDEDELDYFIGISHVIFVFTAAKLISSIQNTISIDGGAVEGQADTPLCHRHYNTMECVTLLEEIARC